MKHSLTYSWETLCVSKDKSGRTPPDDVALVLPGQVAAVFDGASRPERSPVNGQTGGRTAAIAAMNATVALSDEEKEHQPASDIANRLSENIARAKAVLGFNDQIATTAAIVFETTENLRIIVIGDSAIRLNRERVLSQPLKCDALVIPYRIGVWKLLAVKIGSPVQAEDLTRKIVLNGLNWAIEQGHLTAAEADTLCPAPDTETNDYARLYATHGAMIQNGLTNSTDHPRGYPILNGDRVNGQVLEATYDKSDIHTVEIYSDGYETPPRLTSVMGWDEQFQKDMTADPHRVEILPGIKGETPDLWPDDRSVVVGIRQ